VTCAGTPAVSDPGPKLIQAVLEEFGNDARIIPIPGPSAVTTIASLSSVPMNEFHFFGYPPAKKGRGGYFRRVAENLYPSILFESPHRLMKTLNDLEKALGVERRVIIGRELTKIFETVYRGSLGGIRAMLGEETPRGEYVILIEPAHRSRSWNQEGKEKVHNGRP
jgi:16S rRNA (cytidine1402-2'-O)-methyltransferase